MARALRATPEFWLNLQLHFDLEMAADAGGLFEDIEPIVAE